jgi:Fic family protein
MQTALRKTRFWAELREQHPQLTPTQTKAINKLFDVGPDGFVNGISTEKYVNLCRVSRATAYRELTALCEMGVLVQTGTGRGTRYKLEDLLTGITEGNGHDAVDFGGPVGHEEL